MDITIHDEIKEVKRELGMRRVVYQKKLDAGTMSREESSRRLQTMERILERLETIARELPLTLSHNPPR